MACERLPVHCCCEPSRRLGWVPVFETTLGKWIVFALRPVLRAADDDGDRRVEVLSITTMVAPLLLPDGTTIDAVKSANAPLAWWREVPGFVEDRGE